MDSVLNLTLRETLQDARWLTESLPLPFYTSFTWGVSAGDARHVLYIISCPWIQSEELCRSLQKFAAVLLLQVSVPEMFSLCFIDNWTVKLTGECDGEYFSTTEATLNTKQAWSFFCFQYTKKCVLENKIIKKSVL